MDNMDINLSEMWGMLSDQGYTKIFYFGDGWNDANNFFKQFISGALIAIVMTGLDQDMMQKNITCRTLKDAQKNVFTFSVILVFANLLFLTLGALLYLYANNNGIAIPERTDQLYPQIAIEHLSPMVGIFFVLGLIAVTFEFKPIELTCMDDLDIDLPVACGEFGDDCTIPISEEIRQIFEEVEMVDRLIDAQVGLALRGVAQNLLFVLLKVSLIPSHQIFDIEVGLGDGIG